MAEPMIPDFVKDGFWRKIRVPANLADCWEWTGALTWSGYGRYADQRDERGRRRFHKAHRISWEIYNGKIPENLCVLHRCDNRKCVNPAHLFLGTRTDNAADRDAKGRHRSGVQPRKTHCPHGHEFTPENTYRKRPTYRECRTCINERARRQRARRHTLPDGTVVPGWPQ